MGLHIKDVPGLRRLLEEESMALHIKDVPGLRDLAKEEVPQGGIVSCGIRKPGSEEAVAGYCQALFTARPHPGEHTRFFVDALGEAQARYPTSHELFLGHKPPEMTVAAFIADAVAPFRDGDGCVPVLITGLEASDAMIADIFAVPAPMSEPVLVRMLVGERSITHAAELMRNLVANVRTSKAFPGWWPLFQTTFDADTWKQFRTAMDDTWRYSAVAINPFVWPDVLEVVGEQVAVAQLPIGHAEGIGSSRIDLGPVRVTGAQPDEGYDVSAFAKMLQALPHRPVNIVLGPSQPQFDDAENARRLARGLAVFRDHGFVV